MAIRKIKGSLVKIDIDDYICEYSYLFYDIDTGCIRIADGTPGGKPACIEGGAGSVAWGDITGDINNQTDLITKFGNYILLTEKGAPNGVATLDGSGLIPASQLPSYVDDVLEFANLASFPLSGEVGKIYVAIDTGEIYRWSGSTYVNISAGSQAVFSTISVSGQSDVVADSISDTLTLVAGTGVTLTTNPTTDEITINATGAQNLWATVNADTGSTTADTTTDTLTVAGGTGINTTVVGDTLTIDYDSATADQNLFETITVTDTDSGYVWVATGSIAADTTNDTATLVSGVGINIDVDTAQDAIRITNTAPNVDQNVFNTFNADTGSTTANVTNDSLTVQGGAGIITAIAGDTLTITYDSSAADQNLFQNIAVSGQNTVVADSPTDTLTLVAGTGITIITDDTTDSITINAAVAGAQNLWETINADAGSTTANTTTDILTVSGGTGITTSIVGDTLTITNNSPNVTQALWETINADTGSTTADVANDTLTVTGGTGIDTSITGDTLTLTLNANINDIADVVITGPVADNELLAYDNGTGDWINQTASEAGLATTTDLGNYIPLTQKGAANGVATLGADSKIPSAQIPSIAITDVYVVADITARDALTVQTGDVAKVNDAGSGFPETYIYDGTTWVDIQESSDVISVNGQTGVVQVNLWSTISADTGSVAANIPADTLTLTGGTGISTSVSGDSVIITNDSPNVDQNLFANFTDGTNTATADTTTDTFTFTAGAGVSVVVTPGTDTLTITNTSPNVDQNLFATVAGDSGSTTADTTTDTLTVAGGTGITTSVSGDTVTITADGVSDTINNTNITTITIVDSIVSVATKWLVRAYEVATPTNVVAEEIFATHDGTTTKISEGSVLKMGSTINGLTFTVTLTGGNTLNLNVASTAAVNVDVKRIAAL